MCYLQEAPKYIDAGYCVVPLIPRSKTPGTCERGYWRALDDWSNIPTIDPRSGPTAVERTRNAGIGLVLGPRSKNVVRFDIDIPLDDPIAKALLAALPPTPVRNHGRRGVGLFYVSADARSRKFVIDGRVIAEVLAEGRQCVLPPSTHPDTGRPYKWVGEGLLEQAVPWI
jgi:hypothetical protein